MLKESIIAALVLVFMLSASPAVEAESAVSPVEFSVTAASAPRVAAVKTAPTAVRTLPAFLIRPHRFKNKYHKRKWYARAYIYRTYGWSTNQWSCVNKMWQRESNWGATIFNPHDAGGIPQALPATKMKRFGNYRDYRVQIRWGAWYIHQRYHTPCRAWAKWQTHSPGWY